MFLNNNRQAKYSFHIVNKITTLFSPLTHTNTHNFYHAISFEKVQIFILLQTLDEWKLTITQNEKTEHVACVTIILSNLQKWQAVPNQYLHRITQLVQVFTEKRQQSIIITMIPYNSISKHNTYRLHHSLQAHPGHTNRYQRKKKYTHIKQNISLGKKT